LFIPAGTANITPETATQSNAALLEKACRPRVPDGLDTRLDRPPALSNHHLVCPSPPAILHGVPRYRFLSDNARMYPDYHNDFCKLSLSQWQG